MTFSSSTVVTVPGTTSTVAISVVQPSSIISPPISGASIALAGLTASQVVPIGPVYELKPAGATFSPPISIVLPRFGAPCTTQLGVWYCSGAAQATKCEWLDGQCEGDGFRISVSHFSSATIGRTVYEITDGGTSDSGVSEAGPVDSGVSDARVLDATASDANASDATASDAMPADGATADSSVSDAAPVDSGARDGGVTDASLSDAALADAVADAPTHDAIAPSDAAREASLDGSSADSPSAPSQSDSASDAAERGPSPAAATGDSQGCGVARSPSSGAAWLGAVFAFVAVLARRRGRASKNAV